MKKQVLELHAQGHGKNRIAVMLGIIKITIKGIIRGGAGGATPMTLREHSWRDEVLKGKKPLPHDQRIAGHAHEWLARLSDLNERLAPSRP